MTVSVTVAVTVAVIVTVTVSVTAAVAVGVFLNVLQEIRMYNCASVLAKVPLLQDVDKGFLSAVVMALRKMLVPQYEVLILEREAPAALFFINQGGASRTCRAPPRWP